MALTHADQLRKPVPDGADAVPAAAREATGFTDKALRSVTMPDGSALLVDADCEDTDDDIRDAYLAGEELNNLEGGKHAEGIATEEQR